MKEQVLREREKVRENGELDSESRLRLGVGERR